MSNETIGIVGVFAFTLFLFMLRHFYLSIRRRDKSRYVAPAAPGGNKRSNSDSGTDDGWLLWTPETDQSDSSNRLHGELAERGKHAEKKGSSLPR
jgi:hypothetical protein